LRLCDRVVLVMSIKYAQRRPLDDIAAQLGARERLTRAALLHLELRGYVRRWDDGQWGLTSSGNTRRNKLTATG
jgi:hypothetical protein